MTKKEVVYEDRVARAVMPEKGLTKGHVVVEPRREVSSIEDLPGEIRSHLFYIASYSATVLFESLDADGTNIVLNEGGSDGEGLRLDVVARYEDDSIDFLWDSEQASPESLSEMQSKLKKETFYIDEEEDQDRSEPGGGRDSPREHDDKGESGVEDAEAEDEYLVKQLKRVP